MPIEQSLKNRLTLADTDYIRVLDNNVNEKMTVAVFKQQIGFNALQSENTALKERVKYLEEHSLIVE